MKGCFKNLNDGFNFDIKYKDEVIATAHKLTPKDMSVINSKSKSNPRMIEGEILIDFDIWSQKIWTIIRSLKTWTLEDNNGKILPIDEENVSNLETNVLDRIYSEIQEQNKEDDENSKN